MQCSLSSRANAITRLSTAIFKGNTSCAARRPIIRIRSVPPLNQAWDGFQWNCIALKQPAEFQWIRKNSLTNGLPDIHEKKNPAWILA